MSLSTSTSRKSGGSASIASSTFSSTILVEEGALGIHVLDRPVDGVRLDGLEVGGHRLELPAAVVVDERVAQDGEQPALGIGAGPVLPPGAVGLEHGVLHEIFGLGGIAGEPQRHAVQRIEVRQRLGVERAPGGGRLGHGKNVMDPLASRAQTPCLLLPPFPRCFRSACSRRSAISTRPSRTGSTSWPRRSSCAAWG